MSGDRQTASRALVVHAEDAPSFWQPVPANGFVQCLMDDSIAGSVARFAMGRQTVAPGCFVRQHTHDRHEEVIHVVSGYGAALLDGVEHPIRAGSTVFIGLDRKHGFICKSEEPLTFAWLLMPGGLQDFFAAIGRPRFPGQPAPQPFARPADAGAIEKQTVFGWSDPAFGPGKGDNQ
ncbi:cupin domain-containing protein [Roseomonas fluvialis]|uniref:Cupin type-2 domain-containing protein n=1 Tax=Roseomonas fluvialis TaxID=1750527 RepID=A0ABM7Y1Q0_9PROT|nr:cupin domain-containing protein [Roseomonas fluvialis]BDG71727.1 hypothetical protein Rmf_16560 [Roseomonas fluvialis]